MKEKYKHILFDLDRTLWDFEKNSEAAIKKIFTHFNISNYQPDFELFFSTYKEINEKFWEDYKLGKISKKKLSDSRFAETFKFFGFDGTAEGKVAGEMYLKLSIEQKHTFPQAHEVISYLHKKYALHIITNGFKEVQEKKLINCNLRTYFDKIITSEDAGFQKPAKEIFDFTFEKTNANKSNSIIIGDDEKADIEGAINAGIDSIWFNPEKKKSIGKAKLQIQSLIELKDML